MNKIGRPVYIPTHSHLKRQNGLLWFSLQDTKQVIKIHGMAIKTVPRISATRNLA